MLRIVRRTIPLMRAGRAQTPLFRQSYILKMSTPSPNTNGSGGGSGGGGNNNNDPNQKLEPSEDLILELYLAMYPEDLGYAHINKSRVRLVASYIHQLDGIPCILTESVRGRLLSRGYLPSEIAKMTPMQAHARLYRLETENIQHQIGK